MTEVAFKNLLYGYFMKKTKIQMIVIIKTRRGRICFDERSKFWVVENFLVARRNESFYGWMGFGCLGFGVKMLDIG